jgi:hypothetical protein
LRSGQEWWHQTWFNNSEDRVAKLTQTDPWAYRRVDQLGARKPRVLKTNLKEIINSRGTRVEHSDSYCMHHLWQMKRCARNEPHNSPSACMHQVHEYGSCMNKESWLTQLEFERLSRIKLAGAFDKIKNHDINRHVERPWQPQRHPLNINKVKGTDEERYIHNVATDTIPFPK